MKIGIPKKILRLGKIKENKKAFFAIFASIIMVATIGTYVVFYPHGTTHEGIPIFTVGYYLFYIYPLNDKNIHDYVY